MSELDASFIAVTKYLEETLDSSIRRVQDFIRYPSVTADREAVKKCAKFLKNLLTEVGCKDTRLVETQGNPIVYGEFPADSPYTLLIYLMYDTQPFDRGEWRHDPLGADIAEIGSGDEGMFGRGAMNSKGPLIAFVNAVEAILKTVGKLPVNLKIVADGEEEIGSPSFQGFLEKHPANVEADACLEVTPSGSSFFSLGSKGIIVLELECNSVEWGKGPAKGTVHSKFKPVLDSPAWHLTKALDTLVDDDEHTILIENFCDVYKPVPSEIELVDRLSESVSIRFLSRFGPLPDKLKDCQVGELIKKIIFEPTINISRLESGHVTEQISTIVPHTAKCTMDIRFWGQDGDALVHKLKKHLRKNGYGDIKVKKTAHLPWYRVGIEEPLAQAVLKSFHDLGFQPQIWPNGGGASYAAAIGRSLGIPMVAGGSISGGRTHGADEYVVIRTSSKRKAGLLECEKSYISILYSFPYFKEGCHENLSY